MYPVNSCKACLRVGEKKYISFNFVMSRYFSNCASINYQELGKLKSLARCSKSYLTDLNRKTVFSVQYSTKSRLPCLLAAKNNFSVMKRQCAKMVNGSADSVQDIHKTNESPKDSQDALTVGPPDDLVQSLGEEGQRKLTMLWMELEVFYQSGYAVPKKMSLPQWKETMELESRSERIEFYKFLCIKEACKDNDRQKKQACKLELEKVRAERELTHTVDPSPVETDYGVNGNTIFLHSIIIERSMNSVCNSWQCQAIQFGQSIVVDFGLAEHMTKFEQLNCADQLRGLYGYNKSNRQPFHLHFCNAGPDNRVLKYVEKYIPNLHSHTCLTTVTEKSYLDLFPKEKLVYLTPHCKNDLETFDHDAVYIIGGIVDKTDKMPVSLAKAKKEGIATARLPLDQYLNWGIGGKSLALDQIMKIMLDIKNTGCWNTTLQYVPKRKLREGETSTPVMRPRFKYRKSLYNDDL